MQPTRLLPSPRSQVDLPLMARRACALLEAGVPLTLLLDLSDPAGPRSHDVYATEPADGDWLASSF